MPSSCAGPSPSKNRRMDLGNGAFGYENTDGSIYYNDGHGHETYQHPDPARCWKRDPDSEEDNDMRMQLGGDEDQMALAVGMGYQADRVMPGGKAYASHGYDGNDSEPDAMPPPYSEHDQKPPKSLPQMQTARRGTQKQMAKRGSYAYLGGGPALSTYRPNMAQGPIPSPHVFPPQSSASRGGRVSTPKPSSSHTPTPRRQPSPTKPSSAHSNPTAPSDKKPARKKCSQCKVPGHDSRNCPLNRYGLGKVAGPSQGLPPQQGYREMSETTTTSTKTTTKHSISSGVLDGRISKAKAAPKKKGTGKK